MAWSHNSHIMRMGRERMLKQEIFEMYKAPLEGDMLMDAPATDSWRELGNYAWDRDYWRARVTVLNIVYIELYGNPS